MLKKSKKNKISKNISYWVSLKTASIRDTQQTHNTMLDTRVYLSTHVSQTCQHVLFLFHASWD